MVVHVDIFEVVVGGCRFFYEVVVGGCRWLYIVGGCRWF